MYVYVQCRLQNTLHDVDIIHPQVAMAVNTMLKAEVGTLTSENKSLTANEGQLLYKHRPRTELEGKMAQAVSTAVEPAGEG